MHLGIVSDVDRLLAAGEQVEHPVDVVGRRPGVVDVRPDPHTPSSGRVVLDVSIPDARRNGADARTPAENRQYAEFAHLWR